MAKSPGEGQYVPPRFIPRNVIGLDGKTYVCSGVSHDAIWADGVQVDTIGGANDSETSIGTPGTPVWNEIPQQFWRSNNPPLKDGSTPPPTPCPEPVIPGYEQIGGDSFFRSQVGVPLEADMTMVGQPLNNGSSVWFSRTCYDLLVAKFKDINADPAPIVKKHRNEWRQILGLPPLS